MSTKDDGRSAFPSHGSMGEVEHRGMSLRDWFAGQALIGLGVWRPPSSTPSMTDYQARVSYAYLTADAMLAERQKSLPV